MLEKTTFGKFIMSMMQPTLAPTKRNNQAFSYHVGQLMLALAANLWFQSQKGR
jgi:hypothetical protein